MVQERDEEGLEARFLLAFRGDRDALVDQPARQVCVLGFDGHVVVAVLAAEAHLFAVDRHGRDVAVLDRLDELRIGDLAALKGVARTAEEVEQGHDQQQQNDPEGNVSCGAQKSFSSHARRPARSTGPLDIK